MLVAEALSESTAVSVTVWALIIGATGIAASVAMWVRMESRVLSVEKIAKRASTRSAWCRHWILVESGKRHDSQPIDISSLDDSE